MFIIIAEDEEILVRVLKEKFEFEGFQVLIARDRQEAAKVKNFLKNRVNV